MMKQLVPGIVLACLMAFPAWAKDYYSLGVQNVNKSAVTLVHEHRGLANYLGKVLKRTVRVEPFKSYHDYLENAKQKKFDFMLAPPSLIMQANRLAGYQPIAKVPGLLAPSFLSLSKTGIAFPEDMKGKRIGFTDKDAMITQLAMAHLQGMGIDPPSYFKSIIYISDVDSVLFAMQSGMIDIGVVNSGLYTAWSSRGNDLNLVMQAKGVPHVTFAVRGDMPESDKAAVREALLKAHLDKDAQDYFHYSTFPNFEAAQLADYEELVKLLKIK